MLFLCSLSPPNQITNHCCQTHPAPILQLSELVPHILGKAEAAHLSVCLSIWLGHVLLVMHVKQLTSIFTRYITTMRYIPLLCIAVALTGADDNQTPYEKVTMQGGRVITGYYDKSAGSIEVVAFTPHYKIFIDSHDITAEEATELPPMGAPIPQPKPHPAMESQSGTISHDIVAQYADMRGKQEAIKKHITALEMESSALRIDFFHSFLRTANLRPIPNLPMPIDPPVSLAQRNYEIDRINGILAKLREQLDFLNSDHNYDERYICDFIHSPDIAIWERLRAHHP